MSENQIESYLEELPGLGKKQKYIYDVLKELGPSSNKQLEDFLNMPPNQVTARVCELQDMGWVVPDGEILNKKTGKYNTVYKALDEQLPPEKRRHKATRVHGIYINRSCVNDILNHQSVHSLDYTVEFKGDKANIQWLKAGVTLYDVEFITANDTEMTFVVPGAKVVARIVG